MLAEPCDFWYKVDKRTPPVDTSKGLYKWKSSSSMPKEASRFLLEIIYTHVAHVNSICAQDAFA
jgi:hypothetical protein